MDGTGRQLEKEDLGYYLLVRNSNGDGVDQIKALKTFWPNILIPFTPEMATTLFCLFSNL